MIRALSIPQANGQFREDAGLMAEMIAYCEADVRAMRAVSKAMRDLTDEELLDYHVNERINDRGVLLDKPLAEAAVRYAAEELVEIDDTDETEKDDPLKRVVTNQGSYLCRKVIVAYGRPVSARSCAR